MSRHTLSGASALAVGPPEVCPVRCGALSLVVSTRPAGAVRAVICPVVVGGANLRRIMTSKSDKVSSVDPRDPFIAPIVFLLTRMMQNLLYEVRPGDPGTFVVVSAVLAVVALLASAIPAYRATRVSPLIALRTE